MCVPRAPVLLHPASAFSRAGTVPGYPRMERGSRVRGWDSSLGFDHSSPERGEKNRSEFHLLWCWERGTGIGERRNILLGIEAIQRTGERGQDVKRDLSSVTLMVSLLIYRIFFLNVKNCTELCKQRCCFL